jgi:SM-20-related protein
LTLVYEELIQSYLDNEFGQSLVFLPNELSLDLKSNLLKLVEGEKLIQAGIGHEANLHKDELYRKDKIFWLDSKHENKAELAFFKLIDGLVLFLNQTCYTGITNYEFHYALYEKGTYYKRHIDQFVTNDSRVFSIIFYLNDNWKLGDGGELLIYKTNQTESISPLNGTMIFFDSAKLAHEVLETQVPRLSITGWLRRD